MSKRIIDQSETYGKGAAIKQAVNNWILHQSQFVIFLDADGSYSFNGVREIISALQSGADVASGSRFISKKVRPKGMGRIHNFGNRVLSQISSIRNGRHISDLCTGLWGFTGEALKRIEINSNGFDLEAELAGEVRKRKLSHSEVPIKWSQRKGGISKLRSIRDGFIILARIMRT
jgi:dolichol-phosphate mannosyltransferase